jgi:nitrite reductase (NADH) small subunit
MIVKLCEAPSLPEEGGLRAFRRGDTDVCVARANGLFAFENRCPHQGAPLSAGQLVGTSIICPYHAWQFDIATGQPAVSSDPCLILFEVRQFSSEVFIKLPDA